MTPRPADILDAAYALASEGRFASAAEGGRKACDDAVAADRALHLVHTAALAVFDAVVLMMHGRYETGLASVRAPLAVLEASVRAPDLAFAYSAIGFVIGKLGDPESGLVWVARAAVLARASGRALELLKVRSDEGCLHGMLQRYERSVAVLTEASTLAQKTAPRFAQAACLNNLAFAWLLRALSLKQMGAAAKAEEAAARAEAWAERALAVSESAKVVPSSAWALATRARARLVQGRDEAAEADLQEALQRSGAFLQVRVEVLRGLVALHRHRRVYEAAREHLRLALELCEGEAYEPVRVALFEDAVLLESEAARPTAALAWWVQHFEAMQSQYRRRHRVDVEGGDLFALARAATWPDPRVRAPADAEDDAGWLDPPTGLLNMRGLEQVGQAAFEQGGGLAVAVLQIDGADDDIGLAGRVAAVLAAAWQRGFVAARGVGAKFILLFPELSLGQALSLCERLRADVCAAEQALSGASVSIGFAAQERQDDLGALVAEAVRALEGALAQGGNRVRQAEGAV